MSRYQAGAMDEFEPGSNGLALKNYLGLTDPVEADKEEGRRIRRAQTQSYAFIGPDTQLSFELICDLHRFWLGDLYPMAGALRKVDVSKDGFLFAPIATMGSSLRALDQVLRVETPCSGMERERLVEAIARFHAELLLVHPFREGNGRLARWVADLMALQAGFPALDWRFGEDEAARRQRYFRALRRGFALDLNPLEELVEEALALSAP